MSCIVLNPLPLSLCPPLSLLYHDILYATYILPSKFTSAKREKKCSRLLNVRANLFRCSPVFLPFSTTFHGYSTVSQHKSIISTLCCPHKFSLIQLWRDKSLKLQVKAYSFQLKPYREGLVFTHRVCPDSLFAIAILRLPFN